MKKLMLMVLTSLLFLGCEGPMGPMGPPGLDGEDGVNIVGEVFEIEGTFNAQGNYGLYEAYGFNILESDKVLAFRLVGVDDDRDVWTLLPQTNFLNQGRIFNYAYNFTLSDMVIYLEGNFDLNTLTAEFTNDQIFRVLIVPADRIDARLDYTDYHDVVDYFGIDDKNVQRRIIN